MALYRSNFYAEWRRLRGGPSTLREDGNVLTERLLQVIWFHQRLLRDKLRTMDGRALTVLHPGFWNHEAGPDFRGAMVQFDGQPPRAGDVEVDLAPSGWHGHRHDTNPNFRNVVLHVVWEAETPTPLPTLVLKSFLDSPLADLQAWLGSDTARGFPRALSGQCCAPLVELSDGQLDDLLRQSAFIRLQAKAAQIHARARQRGWEQALWEGLFRALGYKQNVWPMQRLAELRGELCPDKNRPDALALQARLLGAGGVLPEQLTRAQVTSDDYVRRLWDDWWREREAFNESAVPRTLWRFDHLRPANHPQRRLALASHWLAAGDLSARLESWCTAKIEENQLVSTLLEKLQVARDDFWSWHWTLRTKRLTKPQPLLGATRATDLAVNVVLPWLWVRTFEGRNEDMQQELERRYFAWPPAEDNAVLRLARQRLLRSQSARRFRTAASQQGLLQVVKDFCDHSNALCAECQFPELVRRWPDKTGA